MVGVPEKVPFEFSVTPGGSLAWSAVKVPAPMRSLAARASVKACPCMVEYDEAAVTVGRALMS